MTRVILQGDINDMLLGLRAVRHLLKHPANADGLVAFEDGSEWYVKRNKASITSRQVARRPSATNG